MSDIVPCSAKHVFSKFSDSREEGIMRVILMRIQKGSTKFHDLLEATSSKFKQQ